MADFNRRFPRSVGRDIRLEVYYERIPVRGLPPDVPAAGGHYRIPDDVIHALGGGNPDMGHAVLGSMFPHVVSAPGVLPAHEVAALGGSDLAAGHKVLRRFVDQVREQAKGHAAG